MGEQPVRRTPYDFSRGVGDLGKEEIDAVVEVLEARSLFRYYGPNLLKKVEAFEQALRANVGTKHAVAVTSGTAALQAGLVGLGIEEGDEVIVPAVTFIATVAAVVTARAVPVFAEVDESLNLDPHSFEEHITGRTKAVVPVHLMNVAADMDPIKAVAARYGLRVLEDAAQAIGTSYRWRRVGSIGDAGAFSLQLEKNITAGEGGALTTDDDEVFDRAVRYQDQGGQFTTSKGDIREHVSGEPFLGTNMRMTELAGAVADVQLRRLDAMILTCRRVAHGIKRDLEGSGIPWRTVPDPDGDGGDLTALLATREQASELARGLRAEGIPAGKLYGGRPVYMNPAVLERRTPWRTGCPWNCEQHPTKRRYFEGLCPASEAILPRAVVIPVGPRMTDADCADVVTAVRRVADRL